MALESHIEKLRARMAGVRPPAKPVADDDQPAPRTAKIKLRSEFSDFSKFPELREYTNACWYYDKQGYEWNMFRKHAGMAGAEIEVEGRRMINYSSFNYLDLSGDERVRAAAKQAIDDFGMATGSGRIIMGEIPLFRQFEQELAQALGVEDAVLGVSGYGMNVATIGYLMRKQDLIVYDELVHNSMLTGAKLSGARRFSFPHNDCDALERLLAEHRGSYERVLIMTEGVFSMDGDIPDIPRLIDIKKRYQALLMVDEAHSIGVIGRRGLGVVDHFGVDPADIDIHYASMSKSFGTIGGYIAGRKELITMLKHYSPGLGLYIASPTPANAASGLAALRIMLAEPQRAHRVIENADYFRKRLQAVGFDTGPSAGSGVVPVMLCESELALWMAIKLFENHISTFPMLFPVVPRNAARLRFFLSVAHTREHLDCTIDMLVKLRAEAPASKGLF